MAKGRYAGDAVCPFYLTDRICANGEYRYDIFCEGIVDKSCIAVRFYERKPYETQIRTFCCEHFTNCEIYRAVMDAKYAEEEEET